MVDAEISNDTYLLINFNKNKSKFAIMTYATPNYFDHLMLYISSIYCTNYDLLSFIYLLNWNQSEIDRLNSVIPNDYKSDSLVLISINTSDLEFKINKNITNKNDMAVIHPLKFKIIQHALCNHLDKDNMLIYTDCDHIIIKNLIPLFDSIHSKNPHDLILYHRKFEYVANESLSKREQKRQIKKAKKKRKKNKFAAGILAASHSNNTCNNALYLHLNKYNYVRYSPSNNILNKLILKTYAVVYDADLYLNRYNHSAWYADQIALYKIYENIKYHDRINTFDPLINILWLDDGLFNYSKHCKSLSNKECPYMFVRTHKWENYDKIGTAYRVLQSMKCDVLSK